MSELKPCPFCGQMPVIKKAGTTGYWWIGCEIHINPEQGCGVSHSSYNKQEAINKWNTRTLERENQQLREELRQCAEALDEGYDSLSCHVSNKSSTLQAMKEALALPSVQAALKQL